jgi:hypothetical protein
MALEIGRVLGHSHHDLRRTTVAINFWLRRRSSGNVQIQRLSLLRRYLLDG